VDTIIPNPPFGICHCRDLWIS